jgi:hypothetical protein
MPALVDVSALLAVQAQIEKMTVPERKSFIPALMPGARVHGDDFAIIPSGSGKDCAIVDLRSKQLCWIEFRATADEAIARLAEPGSVEELRELMVEKLRTGGMAP